MKSKITILVVILINIVLFSASDFFLSLYPVLSLNDYPIRTQDYTPIINDLSEYYSYPAFGSFGVEYFGENYLAIFRIDLRQDISAYLRGRSWSNLLIDPIINFPYVDTNMPMIGFAQYEKGLVRLSIGRRKLKYGPATYDFTLSDSIPYFDHLWFDLKLIKKKSPFFYNYFIISGNRSVFDSPRSLIGHKLGYENSYMRLGLEETNLVSEGYPDLQDLSPFAIFHNNYNKNTNVNAGIYAELKFEKVFFYSKLVADDIEIPGDRTKNPHSVGWNVGITYSFFEDSKYEGPQLWESDYTLKENTLSFTNGGLNITYEHYHSTPYLYNRRSDSGKYIYPVRLNAADIEEGEYLVITGYFGFPYGPDCTLEVVNLTYETKNIEFSTSLEILRKGSYGIDDPYEEPFLYDWYKIVEPISNHYYANFDFKYSPNSNQELFFSMRIGLVNEFLFNFKLGYGLMFSF